MSIKTKLLAVLGVLTFLVAALAGITARQAWSRSQVLQQAIAINHVTDLIGAAENSTALERSQALIALTSFPVSDETRRVVGEQRRKTDAALSAAVRGLDQTFPDTRDWADESTLVAVRTAADVLPGLRKKIDVAFAAKEDPGNESQWYSGFDQLVLAELGAARLISNHLTGDVPTAVLVGFEVKNALWEMMYAFGRERTNVAILIARAQSLTLETLNTTLLLQGEGQRASRVVVNGESYLGQDYRDQSMFTTMAIQGFSLIRREVYREGLSKAQYSVTRQDWQAQSQKVMAELWKLREITSAQIESLVDENRATISHSVFVLAVAFGVALLVVGLGAFSLVFQIARRIAQTANALKRLTQGDDDFVVPHDYRRDEIGTMNAAVEAFQQSLRHSRSLEKTTDDLSTQAEVQRRELLQQVAGDFEKTICRIAEMLENSALQQQDIAREMVFLSGETSEKSSRASSSTEQTAGEVNLITASAEALDRSVETIGVRVEGATGFAAQAVDEVGQTTQLVAELGQAAERITDVIGVIATIADQTNLLALNATIEAARAGEAGRGFSVVASEVKSLAGATARATVQVGDQVRHIQNSSAQAIKAIELITARIKGISGDASVMNQSIEEHSSSARIMLQSVKNAVAGMDEIRGAVADVAQSVSRTGSKSSRVLESASDLLARSEELKSEVAQFMLRLRAA
jgi:methyl-accepting chemotaxis protein